MRQFLVIVEGPHDASFVGVVLKEQGYKKVQQVASVGEYWADLIPSVFPAGPKLDHVVRYPDVYHSEGANSCSCAVIVAGGDSQLVAELRATMEALDGSQLTGICIIADADSERALQRHSELCQQLVALNETHEPGGKEGGSSGVPGFPLQLPTTLGVVEKGAIRVGIYVFPDNDRPGTLDGLLLECAETSLASVYTPAIGFVDAVHETVIEDVRFKALRKPSGKDKASAGVIANVLFPGVALSAAIERAKWFEPLRGDERGITTFRKFFTELLAE